MGSAMPTVDYAPVIRAEIEREIERLKRDLVSRGWVPAPTHATVGSIIALHKGERVIQEGEVMAGLPVSIDAAFPRTITVYNRDSKKQSIW